MPRSATTALRASRSGGTTLPDVVIRYALGYIPMRDLTVTSEHSFYGLAGQPCYAVKGDVVG